MQLHRDSSVSVSGVALEDSNKIFGEVLVSEPRIYRFVLCGDSKWRIQAISDPIPLTATRHQVFDLLSAALKRKIVEALNQSPEPTYGLAPGRGSS